MTPSILFSLGLTLTIGTAAAVIFYMRQPLRDVLVELCGTQQRAAFWVSFSNVAIALVPVIFAMQYTPDLKEGSALLELAAQLKWALVGLLSAVVVLGWVLSRFVRRFPIPSVGTKTSPAPSGPSGYLEAL
jgi:undecaprenyl pyrophosphate phosphatase UppP